MPNPPAHTRPSTAPRALARRNRPPSRSTKVMPMAIGLVLLLAAVTVAVGLASSSDRNGTTVAQTRPVEVGGGPLAPFDSAGSDAAVGRLAPEVWGEGFDGNPVEIVVDGTPKLVVFLAHWCPHCRNEVPVIVDWTAMGAPQGVDVVAVSSSVDRARPNYPPSAWLEREGWTIPTLADDEQSSVGAAFGLTGYPYFVAVNGEGRVVARAGGEQSVPQLEALASAARG